MSASAVVLGRCLEDAGDLDRAVTFYTWYLTAHPQARGVSAVAAQRTLALGRQGQGLLGVRRAAGGQAE